MNLKRISVEKPNESHLGWFYFYQVGNEIAIPVYGKTSSINCGSPTDNFYAKQIYFTKTTKLLHVKFAIEFKNTLFLIFLFQFITSTFNNCTFLLLDEDTNQFYNYLTQKKRTQVTLEISQCSAVVLKP